MTVKLIKEEDYENNIKIYEYDYWKDLPFLVSNINDNNFSIILKFTGFDLGHFCYLNNKIFRKTKLIEHVLENSKSVAIPNCFIYKVIKYSKLKTLKYLLDNYDINLNIFNIIGFASTGGFYYNYDKDRKKFNPMKKSEVSYIVYQSEIKVKYLLSLENDCSGNINELRNLFDYFMNYANIANMESIIKHIYSKEKYEEIFKMDEEFDLNKLYGNFQFDTKMICKILKVLKRDNFFNKHINFLLPHRLTERNLEENNKFKKYYLQHINLQAHFCKKIKF